MEKNNILADTSVLIDLQRGATDTIEMFDRLKEQVAISRITACEFIFGSRNKEEKKTNKDFLEQLSIIEITPPISKFAYVLLDKYTLKLHLGIADALIASTTVVQEMKLWTLNKKHFRKIKEVDLF